MNIYKRSNKKPVLGGKVMVNRKKLLDETFELALQNDMNYLG